LDIVISNTAALLTPARPPGVQARCCGNRGVSFLIGALAFGLLRNQPLPTFMAVSTPTRYHSTMWTPL